MVKITLESGLEIKSFLTQSSHDLLLALVEDLEGKKRKVPIRPTLGGEYKRKNDPKYQEACMIYMVHFNYNAALSNIQSSLREIAKKKKDGAKKNNCLNKYQSIDSFCLFKERELIKITIDFNIQNKDN